MAADTHVLLAAMPGRKGGVIHLPDRTGVPYCPWLGDVVLTTVAEARAAGAHGCNKCPQIKAAAARTSP